MRATSAGRKVAWLSYHNRRSIYKVASGSYQVIHGLGLKVLKNKLSEYVRLGAGDETVLVTERDRVVTEIEPPQPGRSPLLVEALLAEAHQVEYGLANGRQ